MDKVSNHLDVVTRHDHLILDVLCPRWEREAHSDICGADEQLRAVVLLERRVAAAFVLGEHVDLRLELLDGLDGSGGRDDLPALHLLALGSAEKGAHVVTGLTALELLVEHFCTGESSLGYGGRAYWG